MFKTFNPLPTDLVQRRVYPYLDVLWRFYLGIFFTVLIP